MSSRTVYLTTLFLGKLSPRSGYTSAHAHSFARNWQLPFLNQWKGENERRKYFLINLHERMLQVPAGIEPATCSPAGPACRCGERGGGTGMAYADRESPNHGVQLGILIIAFAVHFQTALRKEAYSNILKISPPKTESFQIKKIRYFSYFCSKHRLWVTSTNNLYYYYAEIRKTVYPCNPRFTT